MGSKTALISRLVVATVHDRVSLRRRKYPGFDAGALQADDSRLLACHSVIMRQTGHKSFEILRRYIRGARIIEDSPARRSGL